MVRCGMSSFLLFSMTVMLPSWVQPKRGLPIRYVARDILSQRARALGPIY